MTFRRDASLDTRRVSDIRRAPKLTVGGRRLRRRGNVVGGIKIPLNTPRPLAALPARASSPRAALARFGPPKRLTAGPRKKMLAGANARGRTIQSMSIPRLSDIARAEPNLIQSAAMGTMRMLQEAVGQMNGERVRAGQRAFDMPGRLRRSRGRSGPALKAPLLRHRPRGLGK